MDTEKVVFVSSAPSLVITLHRDTEEHPEGQAVFVNGRLETSCETTIAEIRKAISKKPNISQLVHEVNKSAGIEAVREHQKLMAERNSRAHQGGLSSSSLRQNAVEVLMEQQRQELDAMMVGTEEERAAAAEEIAKSGISQTEKSNEVVRNNDLKPDGAQEDSVIAKPATDFAAAFASLQNKQS